MISVNHKNAQSMQRAPDPGMPAGKGKGMPRAPIAVMERALYGASDPVMAASGFQDAITDIWGK